jgi:hypothetical protein
MRARAYTTIYKCEQFTMEKGYDFWLCHTTKKVDGLKIVVDCHHTKYHVEKKLFESKSTGSATESSVTSGLIGLQLRPHICGLKNGSFF